MKVAKWFRCVQIQTLIRIQSKLDVAVTQGRQRFPPLQIINVIHIAVGTVTCIKVETVTYIRVKTVKYKKMVTTAEILSVYKTGLYIA